MRELNEIERGDLCQSAIELFYGTTGGLTNFPGILKNIIRYRAWESRVTNGKVVKLESLKELITEPPVTGWGESVRAIESVISDDTEALTMLRDELAGERGGNNNPDGCNQYKAVDGEVNNYNVIFDQDKPTQGNSKAYTASRLHKENPDLYKDVIDGKLSANAAAIKAGFRKKNISIPHDPQEAARALKRKYEKTEWDLLIAEIQLLND